MTDQTFPISGGIAEKQGKDNNQICSGRHRCENKDEPDVLSARKQSFKFSNLFRVRKNNLPDKTKFSFQDLLFYKVCSKFTIQ
jgi:hypothetical protein